MNNKLEDAKRLTAHIFQLELELKKGEVDEDEESKMLIKFAEDFEENVKSNLRFVKSEEQE